MGCNSHPRRRRRHPVSSVEGFALWLRRFAARERHEVEHRHPSSAHLLLHRLAPRPLELLTALPKDALPRLEAIVAVVVSRLDLHHAVVDGGGGARKGDASERGGDEHAKDFAELGAQVIIVIIIINFVVVRPTAVVLERRDVVAAPLEGTIKVAGTFNGCNLRSLAREAHLHERVDDALVNPNRAAVVFVVGAAVLLLLLL
mmetsp:Transcript_8306/g.27612  ORF Transcript_8306/g.27612 Transcript_8306/m.27612 type:complete len:202 (-) Transcript_8306:758-1363(-)